MRRARLVLLGVLLAAAPTARAGINIPSDGSDGQLYVTNNRCIDLALAVSGNWDSNNTANAGRGIYDSNKWAVVFKYTNIYIAANATVTFSNHPSRAPVVWLVNGNVTVNGTVSLEGANSAPAPTLAEPGPGGFRGGMEDRDGLSGGPGFGPGGGRYWAGDGSYGTLGRDSPSAVYGNASLLPLVGGSGGAGSSGGGAGGGGAILVACGSTFTLGGTISARGGSESGGTAGGGSGGAIRLIGETLTGGGTANASGGNSGAGAGRIRVERVAGSGTQVISPTPSVVALDPGATPLIWLPDDGPMVSIVSIGDGEAPADPRAVFGLGGADMQLLETNSVPVVVQTRNVEQISQVIVRVTPLAGANYSAINATVQEVVSTNPPVILWRANVPVQLGHSAIQVRVVRP